MQPVIDGQAKPQPNTEPEPGSGHMNRDVVRGLLTTLRARLQDSNLEAGDVPCRERRWPRW